MICKACGSELPNGTSICPVCGENLIEAYDVADDYVPIDFGIKRMLDDEDQGLVPDFSAPVFDDGPAADLVVDSDARVPDFSAPVFEDESENVAPAVDLSQATPDFEAPKYEAEGEGELIAAPGDGVGVGGKPPVKKSRIAAVAIAALLALGGVGFALSPRPANPEKVAQAEPAKPIAPMENKVESFKPQEQVAIETAHPIEVTIPVNVEGLNEAGSRIPVQFEGTTSEGILIDGQHYYLSSDGTGVMMIPGTYALTVVASPISADGLLYHLPDAPLQVTAHEDGTCETSSPEGLTLVPMEAADITDAHLRAAMQWISKDPKRSDLTDALADVARARRDKAVEEREKQRVAEEKRIAAEQKKQQQQQAPKQVVQTVVVPNNEQHTEPAESGDPNIQYGEIVVEVSGDISNSEEEGQQEERQEEQQPAEENQNSEPEQESGEQSNQEEEQSVDVIDENASTEEESPAEGDTSEENK